VSELDAYRVSCVLYVLIWHLMGSAGCGAARLKSRSAKLTARHGIALSSAPSRGRRSARELGSISSSAQAARLCPYELGAVPQHRIHDDGETTGERNLRFAHCRSLTIAKAHFLSFSGPL
jgi:hypothetical protein